VIMVSITVGLNVVHTRHLAVIYSAADRYFQKWNLLTAAAAVTVSHSVSGPLSTGWRDFWLCWTATAGYSDKTSSLHHSYWLVR